MIDTTAVEETTFERILKVALVEPAGTVTTAGTRAATGSLFESTTWAPPAGAGRERTTLAFALSPDNTLVGLIVREDNVVPDSANFPTDKIADLVAPPAEPDMDMLELEKPILVFTGNVAKLLPSLTTTLDGTVATAASDVEREMTVPPDGAGVVNATVPCAMSPPATLTGFIVSVDKPAPEVISSAVAVFEEIPRDAFIVNEF